LSPTPSTASSIKTIENTEEDPDDPEPEYKADIQMEYPSDYLHSPSIVPATKNCL
jgi:hypothetical protein